MPTLRSQASVNGRVTRQTRTTTGFTAPIGKKQNKKTVLESHNTRKDLKATKNVENKEFQNTRLESRNRRKFTCSDTLKSNENEKTSHDPTQFYTVANDEIEEGPEGKNEKHAEAAIIDDKDTRSHDVPPAQVNPVANEDNEKSPEDPKTNVDEATIDDEETSSHDEIEEGPEGKNEKHAEATIIDDKDTRFHDVPPVQVNPVANEDNEKSPEDPKTNVDEATIDDEETSFHDVPPTQIHSVANDENEKSTEDPNTYDDEASNDDEARNDDEATNDDEETSSHGVPPTQFTNDALAKIDDMETTSPVVLPARIHAVANDENEDPKQTDAVATSEENEDISQDPDPTDANLSNNLGPDFILGCIDADLTATFIDSEFRKSHKYTNLDCDIYDIISPNARARKLHKEMTKSYAQSFEYVKYTEIDSYSGTNFEFALKARKKLPKKVIIPGIDGYLADAPANAPDFSLFGSKSNGKERIMLGPASFINHCCKPNAEYACGGETRNSTIVRIQTLRQIEADEEIFVCYGPDYFGPQNQDCRCEICLQRIFAPPTLPPSPEVVSLSLDVDSHEPSSAAASPSSQLDSTLSLPGLEPPSDPSTSLLPNETAPPSTPKKTEEKAKYDEMTQCLICEKAAKRIDKHFKSHHPELKEEDIVLLKDFLRMQKLHANTKVFYCEEHNRLFSDKAAHKRHKNCNMEQIRIVPNFQSKRFVVVFSFFRFLRDILI